MSYTTQSIFTLAPKFVYELQTLFGEPELDRLHELLDKEYTEQFKVGADSCTNLHDTFYTKYKNGWVEMENLYDELIRDVIAPTQNEDFLYQKFPTIRFHVCNHVAVGDFHTDSEFNHPIGELNYVLPLTNSKDTASIWVECTKGREDYVDMDMQVGELIQFNGNQLRHGNKINLTGKTRVSMDFRILPASFYHPEQNSSSLTRKTKFVEGEYYKRFNK